MAVRPLRPSNLIATGPVVLVLSILRSPKTPGYAFCTGDEWYSKRNRRDTRNSHSLPEPNLQAYRSLQSMVRLRSQFQEKSAKLHGHTDTTPGCVGGSSVIHMQ